MDSLTPHIPHAEQLLAQGIDAARDGRQHDAIACFRQALALRPGMAAAQANLGLMLLAAGRHEEARSPLRAALAQAPANAALHNALGIALRHCGQGDEAQQHYETAARLQPACAAAHHGLGLLLQAQDRLDEAIEHYRRAVACEPDHVEALNNLGNCLKRQGALDEARALYDRVLALRPGQLEAHFNLAQIKRYRPGDTQVDDLLQQRERVAALPETARIRYWFTAGKMLEDVGRHDESFAAYAEGNRLKHARTPWNEAQDAQLHQRIAATFTSAVIARGAASSRTPPARAPIPVFIVGMPRSGTTLIEQLLAPLPGVHVAGEITDLGEVLQSAAADHAGAEFRFPESLAGYPAEAFERLGRRYLERIARLAPQATHVVDKLPANYLHLGLIHLMLPEARIVHATRDAMDTCLSCYSQLFSGDNLAFTYDLDLLGRSWLRYDALMRHWRAVLPPGRVLDLPYEDLVADLEPQARRLLAHIGLPWDARCLGFHTHQRPVRTASVAQVRQPLYSTSVGRWQRFAQHLRALQATLGRAG